MATPKTRTSHSLSRRSADQSARNPSSSRNRLEATPTSSRNRLESSPTSPTASQSFESDALSDSPSRRKMRLDKKISERQEADMKEREREQRKALLKEKRLIGQQLVQARHAANEQHSKVKRGLHDIEKVQTELERLNRWRDKENERLNTLMRELIEEQQALEEEYESKHGEASEIKSTLEVEQQSLESDLRLRVEDERKSTSDAARVEEALCNLDRLAGIIRKDTPYGIPSLEEMGNGCSGVTTCSTTWSRFGLESSLGVDSNSSGATSSMHKIGYGSLVIEGAAANDNRKSSCSSPVTRACSSPGNIDSSPMQSTRRVLSPGRHPEMQITSNPLPLSSASQPGSNHLPLSSASQPGNVIPIGQPQGVGHNSAVSLQMARSDSNLSSMTQKLTSSEPGHQSPPVPLLQLTSSKPLPAAFPMKIGDSEQRIPPQNLRVASPVRSAMVSNSQQAMMSQPMRAPPTRRSPRRVQDRSESPSPTLLTQSVSSLTPILQKQAPVAVRQVSPVGRRTAQTLYNITKSTSYPPLSVQQGATTTSAQVPLYTTVAPGSAVAPSAVPVSSTGLLNWDV